MRLDLRDRRRINNGLFIPNCALRNSGLDAVGTSKKAPGVILFSFLINKKLPTIATNTRKTPAAAGIVSILQYSTIFKNLHGAVAAPTEESARLSHQTADESNQTDSPEVRTRYSEVQAVHTRFRATTDLSLIHI